MNVYSVIFKTNGKKYYFKGENTYKIDDYVIVETEKGLQLVFFLVKIIKKKK